MRPYGRCRFAFDFGRSVNKRTERFLLLRFRTFVLRLIIEDKRRSEKEFANFEGELQAFRI